MSPFNFRIPDTEIKIIWRYLDGVSQALAKRFKRGSPPHEDNLSFLLCELLDEGVTGCHILEYPLLQAKKDLEQEDSGITLNVSFQTHKHTNVVEHAFSGADLGVVFVLEHPYFGQHVKAILLQAKRLFPNSSREFTLNSSFNSFRPKQLDMLKMVRQRFSAHNSIFYLWYSPASDAFLEDDAKLIRSLEASSLPGFRDAWHWHPILSHRLGELWPWHEQIWLKTIPSGDSQERERAWRRGQPAARISGLSTVNELAAGSRNLSLMSLYGARLKRRSDWLAFEPFANAFLLGLLSDGIGNSSKDWIRLAQGEKVAMPASESEDQSKETESEVPDVIPPPRHTLTFTVGNSPTMAG